MPAIPLASSAIAAPLLIFSLLPSPQKRSASFKHLNENEPSDSHVSDPEKNMLQTNSGLVLANYNSDRNLKTMQVLPKDQERALELLPTDQKRPSSHLNTQLDHAVPAVSSSSSSLPSFLPSSSAMATATFFSVFLLSLQMPFSLSFSY